jgi:hypothetical protein
MASYGVLKGTGQVDDVLIIAAISYDITMLLTDLSSISYRMTALLWRFK